MFVLLLAMVLAFTNGRKKTFRKKPDRIRLYMASAAARDDKSFKSLRQFRGTPKADGGLGHTSATRVALSQIEHIMARKLTDTVHLRLRFDERLRRHLEQEAARNKRSMNAEIIDRLEKSFTKVDQEKLHQKLATAGAMEALTIIGWTPPAQGSPVQVGPPTESASSEHPAQDEPTNRREKGA
jgi:hypothetical protein